MKYRLTHRVLPLLAALSLLFGALLPFFAVYQDAQAAPALQSQQAASLFGEKILLCTGDGFKWISWQELQKTPSQDRHTDLKCPLCYIAAHGLAPIMPTAVMAPQPTHADHGAPVTYALSTIAYTGLPGNLRSRAPPSV